jgi:GT2 family glycosyltransferase
MLKRASIKPTISVIISSYQNHLITEGCLESIKQCSYPNLEIILVAQAEHEHHQLVANKYNHVFLIKLDGYMGFSRAYNIGINHAKGEFILLLNNDTEVAPDFLDPMIELFLLNSRAGIVGSKILYFNNKNIVKFAGSSGINLFTGRGFTIGFQEQDRSEFDELRPSAFTHGASMMIRRTVLEEIGLLPEQYFLYYEEIDFSLKSIQKNWEVWYCGTSRVYHKEEAFAAKQGFNRTYYLNRNRLLFIRRNAKGIEKIAAVFFIIFVSFPKNILKSLIKGNKTEAKAIFRALIWNLVNYNIKKNTFLTDDIVSANSIKSTPSLFGHQCWLFINLCICSSICKEIAQH